MIIQCLLWLIPPGNCFLYGDELFMVLDPEGSEVEFDKDQGGTPDVFVCSIDGATVGFIPADTIVTPVGCGFMAEPFGE